MLNREEDQKRIAIICSLWVLTVIGGTIALWFVLNGYIEYIIVCPWIAWIVGTRLLSEHNIKYYAERKEVSEC